LPNWWRLGTTALKEPSNGLVNSRVIELPPLEEVKNNLGQMVSVYLLNKEEQPCNGGSNVTAVHGEEEKPGANSTSR